jgi:hypothetical protein
MLATLDKMILASINRGMHFIVFLLYIYISIFNETYYLVTFFLTTCFSHIWPSGILYRAKIVALYVKIMYNV